MGKRFSSSFDSPVPPGELFALLTDAGWPARKGEWFGDGSQLVSREVGEGGAVTVVVSRALPAGVPGFLQKFLPSDRRVTTTDAWAAGDGERSGTWRAVIAGAPASMGGTMRITEAPGGSRYTIDGEVKVPVPILGGKAEGFIAEAVGKLAEREAALVDEVLSGR